MLVADPKSDQISQSQQGRIDLTYVLSAKAQRVER